MQAPTFNLKRKRDKKLEAKQPWQADANGGRANIAPAVSANAMGNTQMGEPSNRLANPGEHPQPQN